MRVDAGAAAARRRCASARSGWRSWCTDRLIATRMRRPASRHSARLAAGFVDDPVAERADQAVALGHRDEDRRADHAALRVVPAHQRLGAGDLAAGRVDLRLVVQLELLARHGLAQVAQQLDLLARTADHARLEEGKGRAAVRLAYAPRPRRGPSAVRQRAVRGYITMPIEPVIGACGPRSRRARPAASSSCCASAAAAARPVSGSSSSTNSSPPTRATCRARLDRAAQALRQRLQQLVADTAAEGIVDGLEAVQPDEEQRHRLSARRRLRCAAASSRVEGMAVGQLRQRVDARGLLDALDGRAQRPGACATPSPTAPAAAAASRARAQRGQRGQRGVAEHAQVVQRHRALRHLRRPAPRGGARRRRQSRAQRRSRAAAPPTTRAQRRSASQPRRPPAAGQADHGQRRPEPHAMTARARCACPST